MEYDTLREQLHKLEERRAEMQNRLPAHSVTVEMMMEVLAIEDELERLQALCKPPAR